MFDHYFSTYYKKQLHFFAKKISEKGISPNEISLGGFFFALLSFGSLCGSLFYLALFFIVMNRLCDGFDGAVARVSGQKTSAGGFLDITLDFLFYGLIPLGFVFADARSNSFAGAFLLFSFLANGVAFLAFAAANTEDLNKKNKINPKYPEKSLYYLEGIAEGGETILCFVLATLMPQHFPIIASIFGAICLLSAILRMYGGYVTLSK